MGWRKLVSAGTPSGICCCPSARSAATYFLLATLPIRRLLRGNSRVLLSCPALWRLGCRDAHSQTACIRKALLPVRPAVLAGT